MTVELRPLVQHCITTTGTPGFSDLPKALHCMYLDKLCLKVRLELCTAIKSGKKFQQELVILDWKFLFYNFLSSDENLIGITKQ